MNKPAQTVFVLAVATAALVGLPLSAQSTRDSAGVRIVENARPTWSDSERLRLGARPRLVIGDDADSSYRFRRVRGVMLLTDGRIGVADGGSLQLRLFSPQGRFLSARAVTPNRPGETVQMQWVRRLRGDTIAIACGLSTLAVYSTTGHYARTTEFPSRPDGRPAAFFLLALLDNGLRVAAPLPIPAPHSAGARWTDSLTLRLVTESNEVVHEFGTFPYIEMAQVGTDPAPVWLAAGSVFAGSDDHFYAGFGDRYAIRVYTRDGKLESIIRRAWTAVPVTSDDWEHWVVAWSNRWVQSTGAARDREMQDVRESPWAEKLPAFTQFIADRSGRLWVRGAHWEDAAGAGALSDIPAVPSTWSVFDVRGRWLGDVNMPGGFQPFEIGTDYVTGTMRTERVNQVVIYDLTARNGRSGMPPR